MPVYTTFINYTCSKCGQKFYTGGTMSARREFGPATVTCKKCSTINRTNWRQWADGTTKQKIGWFVYHFFDTMIKGLIYGVILGLFFVGIFLRNADVQFAMILGLVGGPVVSWIFLYVRAIYKVTQDLL